MTPVAITEENRALTMAQGLLLFELTSLDSIIWSVFMSPNNDYRKSNCRTGQWQIASHFVSSSIVHSYVSYKHHLRVYARFSRSYMLYATWLYEAYR